MRFGMNKVKDTRESPWKTPRLNFSCNHYVRPTEDGRRLVDVPEIVQMISGSFDGVASDALSHHRFPISSHVSLGTFPRDLDFGNPETHYSI
jgi:hypothetical protein